MQNYKTYPHKAAVHTPVIYTLVVVLGTATGVSFGYVYKRLPAMQIRYETPLKETEKAQKEMSDKEIQGQDSFDDFIYENFYQPVRATVDTWKAHVKDSLQAERSRTLREKTRD